MSVEQIDPGGNIVITIDVWKKLPPATRTLIQDLTENRHQPKARVPARAISSSFTPVNSSPEQQRLVVENAELRAQIEKLSFSVPAPAQYPHSHDDKADLEKLRAQIAVLEAEKELQAKHEGELAILRAELDSLKAAKAGPYTPPPESSQPEIEDLRIVQLLAAADERAKQAEQRAAEAEAAARAAKAEAEKVRTIVDAKAAAHTQTDVMDGAQACAPDNSNASTPDFENFLNQLNNALANPLADPAPTDNLDPPDSASQSTQPLSPFTDPCTSEDQADTAPASPKSTAPSSVNEQRHPLPNGRPPPGLISDPSDSQVPSPADPCPDTMDLDTPAAPSPNAFHTDARFIIRDHHPLPSGREHNGIRYRWEAAGPDGQVLVLMPTPDQYKDMKADKEGLPMLFTCAKELGAEQGGAFIIEAPPEMRKHLPQVKTPRTLACASYIAERLNDGFVCLATKPGKAVFDRQSCAGSALDLDTIITAFEKCLGDQNSVGGITYCTDIPARSPYERKEAGLPPDSPVWPIRGNKLLKTAKSLVGIHTPTGYEGTGPFAWHIEDFFLGALNYLHQGKKVWFWTEPHTMEIAITAFRESLGGTDCTQFLRHLAVHTGVHHLRDQGIKVRQFKQVAGQLIVLYPRVYHSGFSATYTVAEAVNYANPDWAPPERYRPCTLGRCIKKNAMLPITFEHLRLLGPGEEQVAEEEDGEGDKEYGDKEDGEGVEEEEEEEAEGEVEGGEEEDGEATDPNLPGRRLRRRRTPKQQTPANTRKSPRKQKKSGPGSYPTSSSRKRPAAEPTEHRSKMQKINPAPEALAANLLGMDAYQRFIGLISAYGKIDDERPRFKIDSGTLIDQAKEYCNLGDRYEKSSQLHAFLSLLFRIQAVEKMDEIRTRDGYGRLQSGLITELCSLWNKAPSTVHKWFSKHRGWGETFRHILPFLPFDDAANMKAYKEMTQKEGERFRKCLEEAPEGKALVGQGEAFIQSVLEGKKYERRGWGAKTSADLDSMSVVEEA